MDKLDERCETCRFGVTRWRKGEIYSQFVASGDFAGGVIYENVARSEDRLECRAHPPMLGEGWSGVKPTDWCGEYQSKDKPNVG